VSILRCWLAAVLLAMIAGAAQADDEPLNFDMPTLGGLQFWADEFLYAEWRIQRNVYTGHWRLLDPDDVRRAWGNFSQCRSAFRKMRQQKHLRPESTHLVMLIHGLGRSRHSFGDLAGRLRGAGYDAAGINYPSFYQSIEETAEQVERVLDRLDGTETISFVTHSLGGLVLRATLARNGAWRERIAVHRAVLVAPPNQGSAVAGLLSDLPPYHWLTGDVGGELTHELVAELPGLDIPFAIIAGGRADGMGFNPLIDGDDDGTLAIAETELAGRDDFFVVDSLHSFVQSDEQSIDAILSYLETGRLGHDG
jgi:pimeloyl-ACP methyl ester carboxylesterase